jgi:hypothetical protein
MSKHDAALKGLTEAFIEAAGLPTVTRIYKEVADKCFCLLQYSVRSWQTKGLIIPGGNGVLIKCPLFQRLWDCALQLSSKRKLSIIPTAQFPEDNIDEKTESLTLSDNAVVNAAPRKVQNLLTGS